MKLILLSGGSGKRLWPLSNNARSKQFLTVLEAPDGSNESMVQRVVRQIREAGLGSQVTIATNAGQKDIILNQLGEDTQIVTEPERRDTFPAIALSCEYLAKQLHCPPSETVVIMPCDPYTDSGYFQVVKKMIQAVENNCAQLVLMGITPTYPSPKYGYIVPRPQDKGKDVMGVQRFTEKPTTEKAVELLKEGALWNGGVFAFKLGYLTDIARKYVNESDFESTRNKYSLYPRISFDYEVAEKAQSVAVLPYTGEWKDLGTWNTLCEELKHQATGNVVLGKNNSNTHVINELGIPIFCDGLQDIIVAASPNGILVCAKKNSETIKDNVESLRISPTIGVFDSGVGGLSVLKELRKAIPDARYIYYSDNANCPYGDKSPEFVTERACAISEELISRGASLIVVACNTATAAAISTLRERFDIPFVGMEPAVKPAALGTKSGVIGVLATAGTLKGSLYLDTKQKYTSNVKIVEGVGHGFVELVESGDLSSSRADEICRTALQPLLDEGADRIVLGCTHYPFLLPTLQKLAKGHGVTFIDPAPAVAARAAQLVAELPAPSKKEAVQPGVELLSSGDTEALKRTYSLI